MYIKLYKNQGITRIVPIEIQLGYKRGQKGLGSSVLRFSDSTIEKKKIHSIAEVRKLRAAMGKTFYKSVASLEIIDNLAFLFISLKIEVQFV